MSDQGRRYVRFGAVIAVIIAGAGLSRLHRRAGQQELLRHHQGTERHGQRRLQQAAARGRQRSARIHQAPGHAPGIPAGGAGPHPAGGLQRHRSAARHLQRQCAGAGGRKVWTRRRLPRHQHSSQVRVQVRSQTAWATGRCSGGRRKCAEGRADGAQPGTQGQ